MINNGSLVTFSTSNPGWLHRNGETVLVVCCLDRSQQESNPLYQVKTRDGYFLMGFEDELNPPRPQSPTAAATTLPAPAPRGREGF